MIREVIAVAVIQSLCLFAQDRSEISNIVNQLGSDDPDVREAATGKLIGLWEKPDVLELVRQKVESPNPEVSSRAVYVCGRISLRLQLGKECIAEIGEEREKELFYADEAQALNLFANVAGSVPGYRVKTGPSRTLLYLAGKVKSNSAKIKLLNLMVAYRVIDLPGKLAELINDAEESVSAAAIYAAGELKMRECSAEILRRLRSKSLVLQINATEAISKMGLIPAYVPDIRRLFSDFFRNL